MASKASKRNSAGPAPDAVSGAGPWPTAEPRPSVLDEVRQLVQLMADNDLGEVDITDGQRKILLKRAGAVVPTMPMYSPAPVMPAAGAAPVAGQLAGAAAAAGGRPAEEPPGERFLEIRSPMVGTFYTSPSPDSDAFVSVGSSVDEDAAVCIIEAMKVMNEVKAECAGTIAEICVKNAQPVEYGQVLFRVRPA